MSGSDLTTVAWIYKREYSDRQIADLTMRDHVQWAMIEKQDGFGGDSFVYPIRYGNPQGVSGKFANAQANVGSSKGMQLTALRQPKFGIITMDGESIAASEGNKGAFFNLVTMETDNVLEELGDSLAFDFYRDTYGIRGTRSSAAGNVITLTVADDARNFKEGMTIGADDTPTGASPRVGTTTISSVDEDGGTITVANAASIAGFADGDVLFRDGDPGTCMEGLEVCTPLTAPAAGDSFRGKDRSVNVSRLSGSRVNDTATNIEENLGLCAVKVSRTGKSHMVDRGFLNPIKFWEVSRRLNAKVEYSDAGGTANYGFQFLTIHTPAGSLRIFSDPDCKTTRGRIARSDAMYVKHLRGLPHIVMDDGKPSLRQASANGIEARAAAWLNLVQTDPAAHGVINIAA